MTENEFTSKLIKSLTKTGVYEGKLTKENSIPFNSVKEHQNHALYVAKHGVFRYKPPDNTGYQNPADVIVVNRGTGYVYVVFWKRGCNYYYLIDVDVWNKEAETSDRKSLTEDRASVIGTKIVIPN